MPTFSFYARHLAVVSALFFSTSNFAYTQSSIFFGLDNDGIVTTDQDYTNGIFLNYSTDFTVKQGGLLDSIPGNHFSSAYNADKVYKYSVELGQKMWTPSDIEEFDPIANARPYAGLLYLTSNLYSITKHEINAYQFMLGTVGPNSFAKEGQKFVHSIVGSDDPKGWDNQIENQIVFNLGYLRSDRWYESEINNAKSHEISSHSRVLAGNFRSEVATSVMWRWGTNLSSSIGSAKVSNESAVDPGLIVRYKTGYFFFAGLEARYRFNDITIEGDRPDDGITASQVEHLQATSTIGIVGYLKGWGASLAISSKTPDFEEDKSGILSNGSIALFWLF